MILNRLPRDGTGITWNALPLAEQLLDPGIEVRLFLMNDPVEFNKEIVSCHG